MSDDIYHIAAFMKEELQRLIKSHPAPPNFDPKTDWFSEDPNSFAKDMPTAKEDHDKEMRACAYKRFWSVSMLAILI